MIRVAIVGYGKIARDQHAPALAKSSEVELVAVASRAGGPPELPSFPTLAELLASDVEIDAVSLCQPPQVRFGDALAALRAGKHVMLEKPPGATLSEVALLEREAEIRGLTLFASWHSRAAPGVEAAKAWLAAHPPRDVTITWREDVRVWHPGQQWIWQAGGLGVFDPGINALSIATTILPQGFVLQQATLSFPSNCATPIAAELRFTTDTGTIIHADFDFRQEGPQTWDIRAESDGGTLLLTHGGSRLSIDGTAVPTAPEAEYPTLYARFAELVRTGARDVDVSPLRHVADAFLRGERVMVEPFEE